MRIIHKPHNMIKVCMYVPSFILQSHACVFTFVKCMCHSTGSDASDVCVAACLIAVVFTFFKGMCHSTSGDTIDVYLHSCIFMFIKDICHSASGDTSDAYECMNVGGYCLCLGHALCSKFKGKMKSKLKGKRKMKAHMCV